MLNIIMPLLYQYRPLADLRSFLTIQFSILFRNIEGEVKSETYHALLSTTVFCQSCCLRRTQDV